MKNNILKKKQTSYIHYKRNLDALSRNVLITICIKFCLSNMHFAYVNN